MIHFYTVRDLKQFGFDCLTGEACGLGMRLLFDLTAPARATLIKALGVNDVALAPAWNGAPAIGSIMLAPPMLRSIAIFAMLDAGCIEVWQDDQDGPLYGIESQSEADEARPLQTPGFTVWRYAGTAKDRNEHAMSGRVQ